MEHLLEYKSYINESEGYNKGVMIIDYLKNSDDGKFLQSLISNGALRDFDSLFKLVKTGRVYINGNYAGNTKFYASGDRWCQISESSGNTYGQACFNTIEELVKYSATRYVLLRKERGFNEGDLEGWIGANWTDVIKKSNAKEVIDAYKDSKGLASMISDRLIIKDLPVFKEYEDIFFPSWIPVHGDINIDIDPFAIYYPSKEYAGTQLGLKFTNKEGYSAKSMAYGASDITIGTSSMDQLDQYLRRALIYRLNKKYDHLIREEYNDPRIDMLIAAKELYIGILSSGNKGKENNLLLALRKIKDENPLTLGKVLKGLRNYNPDVVDKFENEFGKKETEAIAKGSNILNRFRI
jgi:hypothetical protein